MSIAIERKPSPVQVDGPASPARDSHWHTRPGARHALQQRRNRFSMDPSEVQFARSYFGVGAALGALALLGVRRYGRPAVAGFGGVGLLSLAYMTVVEPNRPRLERVTLRLPALPRELDGLRVGQITDIHYGLPHTARNLAWAVAQMGRERPDLLAFTGDMAHFHWAIPQLTPLLRRLSAPLGMYAVTGNHDHWEGVEDLRAALALGGVTLLRNEHRRLGWNGGDLWLLGIDDLWEGQPDLVQALRGVPSDGFKLLLSHAPDHADDAARQGVAVQLSGHTHGGHLRLPVLGPYGRPRFGQRYVMGWFDVGGMALYVSRGLGGAPLRLFCRPEATIFTLRRG